MSIGLLALLDDVAMLVDDTAVVAKIAAKKTVGILGDDLAVNAQKASGFAASREIPVLVAITKGSLKNKFIILPFAFVFSAFVPWIIVPILLLGGIYLSYEGFEKIYEYFFTHHNEETEEEKEPLSEEEKIRSAITTDFILSIEIVIMALSTVVQENLMTQLLVVSFVAVLATVGVYGVVALIVRLDDMGLTCIEAGVKKEQKILVTLGEILVASLPKIIRALTVIGTLAMLLVAGGIFVHHIEPLHHIIKHLHIPNLLGELGVGLIIGGFAFIVKVTIDKLRNS